MSIQAIDKWILKKISPVILKRKVLKPFQM